MGGYNGGYSAVSSPAEGDELRDHIQKTAKKYYKDGNFDADSLETALEKHRKVVPVVDLEDDDCTYKVEAVPVSQGGLGLEDYGYPLNHGLIRLCGLRKYMIIEMGTGTKENVPRRHSDEYRCNYVQFANLMVQGYTCANGNLVGVLDYSGYIRTFNYHGWGDADCWQRVRNVCAGADLPRPTCLLPRGRWRCRTRVVGIRARARLGVCRFCESRQTRRSTG